MSTSILGTWNVGWLLERRTTQSIYINSELFCQKFWHLNPRLPQMPIRCMPIWGTHIPWLPLPINIYVSITSVWVFLGFPFYNLTFFEPMGAGGERSAVIPSFFWNQQTTHRRKMEGSKPSRAMGCHGSRFHHLFLVGGWTHPLVETYAVICSSKWVHVPQVIRGEHKKCLKAATS